MTEHQTISARTLPSAVVALAAVAALVLGGAVLLAMISAIGLTAVVLLSGVLGSFAVVALAVLRRRPVSVD